MFEKLGFTPTLSDQVAQALLARIESGQLRPGEKLPSEAVLAVEFGVSRTVVREAVSRLKHEALLESRQGSGVFVSLHTAMKPLKIDASVTESREEVLQIVELRRALESEAASVAAQRRSSSQLAEIEAAFDAIDAEVAAGGDGVLPDIAFHRAIAQATGNPYFVRTLDFLTQYLTAATRVTRANEARRLQLIHETVRVESRTDAPPGNWEKGDRGLASLPGREEEFQASIRRALEYAAVLGNKRLHVMAGLLEPGLFRSAHRAVDMENMSWAAAQADVQGITIFIEPINGRDMPGYFVHRQDQAHALCGIGASNLRVQFDFYHAPIVEGDLSVKLHEQMPGIGHIQVAGVPDRHELDEGELNYPYLFRLLDELGYGGWVGCEYRPRARTSAGLGWLRPWL